MAVYCLACELNPLSRADFDGLCLSCRAAVANGLIRIQWVYGPDLKTYRRVLEFVTAAEHPFGCQFPDHLEPVDYDPERLAGLWAEDDRRKRAERLAEVALSRVETEGE